MVRALSAGMTPAVHLAMPPSNALAVAEPIVRVANLSKVFPSGFKALDAISLEIKRGEIFALLGPNGAGKTTLISIICGIVNASEGSVIADGHDIRRDYRAARSKIGLVPQELTTDTFETVWNTMRLSRGLFGKPADHAHLERVLRDVSLWDRRNDRIMTLSGGMKRRVMIAKALSHEPIILFLDEPTAGVDVELRRDMWRMVRALKESGVTIILTTHYIEEAEDLADRIGVINNGRLILVEEKAALMSKLGKKKLVVSLQEPLARLPDGLAPLGIELSPDGRALIYTYETATHSVGVRPVLQAIEAAGLIYRDIDTQSSSLEEIFVDIIRERA
jgi:ABC-2 type transport system ATP-binding protein